MQSTARLFGAMDRKAVGPSPTFARAHLLMAFLTIGKRGTIGRHALAEETGLGEGSIRTVLKRLREAGLADSAASGCRLTRRGQEAYSAISTVLSPTTLIEGTRLTMGSSQVAISIRGGAARVRSGIEQRDSAIGVGAAGATTYIVRGSRFTIPGGSDDCERDFPGKAWGALRKKLRPGDGDAIIVCGADGEGTASLGAFSAALSLL